MGDYNEFAEDYALKTLELENSTREHYRSLLPSDLKLKKILDVGCGSGQDVQYYTEQNAEVFGLDISEKEIEMAKSLGCGKFIVADMKSLPYDSNTLDVVTSFYSLQASDDVPKTLSEMIRVTKKGGIILILTKHPVRNMLESWKNDDHGNYYEKRIVTSHIFQREITLKEPGHTLMEYLNPKLLQEAELQLFEEHSDFPVSDQITPELFYPTYFIMKMKKK